ncbi:MAG: NAD(P)H-dependent oxidoreductase [Rubrivivax sp.]
MAQTPQVPKIRKGQAPAPLPPADFGQRFAQRFTDPAFDAHRDWLQRLQELAYDAYDEGRKAPLTHAAGPGYADPDYQLSDEWRATSQRVAAAAQQHARRDLPDRVLLICASPRNDGSCPGEVSKTWRLANVVQEVLQGERVQVDLLDLSRITSDPMRHIHPCKGCVSTAMPLCHWPCSCYPNHALGQTGDWMNEIYPLWTAAHGVAIVTPVHWYAPPSVLKLMMDRLVCADGGNPDPTTTHGKNTEEAKALELAGWDYPKHLADRAYALVVHGDVEGVESVRRTLAEWLDWMGLIDGGELARLQRYVGYWQPYAVSHDLLDADRAVQEETRNAARALVHAVRALRAGRLQRPDAGFKRPRPK